MKLYLKSLGCRLNEAELENWAEAFLGDGHALVHQPEQADVIILNTCAVTREAVKKSRQLIKRAHRQNPSAKLVVSGCYASLEPKLRDEFTEIDLLVPNQDKDRLPYIIRDNLLPAAMPAAAMAPGTASLYQRGRNRAFIKIQDGCRYRCTFCIVTVARGRERSILPGNIIDHINLLHDQGVKEAVLTGVHVGGYGSDINSSLYTLVESILRETDIPRIRLASVEPWDLPENFFELFGNARLMPHMHLPLQSGSDEILKTMARRCRTSDFSDLIKLARQVPGFNVTTDIIVGFPGESESEWEKSLEFIATIGFAHVHIFPYSARSGTHAAGLPGQVSAAVKKQRCRELHTLAGKMKKQFLQQQTGNRASVLIENSPAPHSTQHGIAAGYTPNYCRVQIEAAPGRKLENQIRDVTIHSLNQTGDGLLARFN